MNQTLSTSVNSITHDYASKLYVSKINQGQDSTFASKEMMEMYK